MKKKKNRNLNESYVVKHCIILCSQNGMFTNIFVLFFKHYVLCICVQANRCKEMIIFSLNHRHVGRLIDVGRSKFSSITNDDRSGRGMSIESVAYFDSKCACTHDVSYITRAYSYSAPQIIKYHHRRCVQKSSVDSPPFCTHARTRVTILVSYVIHTDILLLILRCTAIEQYSYFVDRLLFLQCAESAYVCTIKNTFELVSHESRT